MELEREKTEKMQAREAQPSTTNKGDQDWKRDNHPKNETCPRISAVQPQKATRSKDTLNQETRGRKTRKDGSMRERLAQYIQQRRPGLNKTEKRSNKMNDSN